MKEIKKNETLCSCSSNECDCGKPGRRKLPKMLLCLVVFLAAFGIIAYKTLNANSNSGIVSSGAVPNNGNSNIPSYGAIRPLSMLNRIPNNALPVNFAFGQPVSENTSTKEYTIQAAQNIGAYVEALDELNIVALDNDVVFVFIPGAGNVSVDRTTKEALYDFQKNLKRNNITSSFYTLCHDSPDYSEIAKQGQMPAIVVARNGAGTATIYGNEISEYTLFQAYRAAAFGECCVIASSDCCGW